jgi:hypothetical protein
MNKQKGNQSRKKANYYTRQFDRTSANKLRRALKRKRVKPLKPGAAERLAEKAAAVRHKRNLRRQAEREAQRQLERKREKELEELQERLRDR